jgi:CRP-like cAMP-binding protein
MDERRSLTETGQSSRIERAEQTGSRPASALPNLHPLDRVGWLAGQPEALRDWAQRSGRWRHYDKDQPLYEVGGESEAMFGLGSGGLDVLIPVSDDEQVVVHRAEPGFWIGDSGILAGTRRSISVVAAAPCQVFSIPAGALRRLLADHPEFWRCFYELAHRNGTLAVATLAEVLSRSPEARLARMLLRLADPSGEVHATQFDLARLLGVTRSSLQRALSHLHAEGAVRTQYGFVAILDRAKLQRAVPAG